ncbi:MAG: pyridoxamine 5'-phosphate oxidase family protein [Deltaproteobacteria bacterium]|nr:pyridoxamine 5'-phosphate oxidase family protein [Deltaproteobacteria bacterium]
MIEKMKQMVKDEKYCVLATALNNKPHCSLMAYTVDKECKNLYMVTSKDSDKYRNLQTNASVSLLIDTRASRKGESAKALTVKGRFSHIEDENTLSLVKEGLIERHPELAVFLNDNSSCVFSIEIDSFQLLDGFTNSYFASIN